MIITIIVRIGSGSERQSPDRGQKQVGAKPVSAKQNSNQDSDDDMKSRQAPVVFPRQFLTCSSIFHHQPQRQRQRLSVFVELVCWLLFVVGALITLPPPGQTNCLFIGPAGWAGEGAVKLKQQQAHGDCLWDWTTRGRMKMLTC